MKKISTFFKSFWRYLPLAFATISFGAGTGLLGDKIKGDEIWPILPGWGSTLLIVAAILGCAFFLYCMAQPRLSNRENWKQMWKKGMASWDFWLVALATVVFGAGIGLLGDSAKGDVVLPIKSWGLSFVIVLLSTFLAGAFLLSWAQKQLPVYSVTKTDKPEAHKVLILPLSAPVPGFNIETNELGEKTLFIDGKHRIPITPHDIAKDEETLREKEKAGNLNEKLRWNWTQILTSIRPHISELKQIHLITSIPTERNPEESHKYAEKFQEFIHSYDSDIEVIAMPGIDFEDYGAVYRNAGSCIREAKCAKFKESDIIIDVTGGPKITSIASSVVTLHNDIKFQYTSNGGKTQEYEAAYVARSSLG